MEEWNPSRNSVLRITGAAVAVFSLVAGVFVMFVLSSRCSYLSSLLLVILSFLFLAGGIVFLVGQLFSWREHRLASRILIKDTASVIS